MANICTGQQQILIIPTWIVRLITKVLKKAIKCLGTSTFFLCLHAVYIGFHDFYMSLRCNVCTLADSWNAKCPVLCHLFRCFDPRFKENAFCQPAFVIRDINFCRNSYLQGRLKSRKSYHCCKCYRIQISYKTHHNIPPFLSTLSGTIREAIYDVVAELKGVTADFSTSKLRMAEDMAETMAECL